jgi:hypothetical protein
MLRSEKARARLSNLEKKFGPLLERIVSPRRPNGKKGSLLHRLLPGIVEVTGEASNAS